MPSLLMISTKFSRALASRLLKFSRFKSENRQGTLVSVAVPHEQKFVKLTTSFCLVNLFVSFLAQPFSEQFLLLCVSPTIKTKIFFLSLVRVASSATQVKGSGFCAKDFANLMPEQIGQYGSKTLMVEALWFFKKWYKNFRHESKDYSCTY